MKKNIINREINIFIKKIIIFTITGVIGIVLSLTIIPDINYTIINWIIHAIVYSFVIGTLYICSGYIFYKDEMKYLLKVLAKNEKNS